MVAINLAFSHEYWECDYHPIDDSSYFSEGVFPWPTNQSTTVWVPKSGQIQFLQGLERNWARSVAHQPGLDSGGSGSNHLGWLDVKTIADPPPSLCHSGAVDTITHFGHRKKKSPCQVYHGLSLIAVLLSFPIDKMNKSMSMKASKFLVKPHAKANVKTSMEVRSQLDHLARVTLCQFLSLFCLRCQNVNNMDSLLILLVLSWLNTPSCNCKGSLLP